MKIGKIILNGMDMLKAQEINVSLCHTILKFDRLITDSKKKKFVT